MKDKCSWEYNPKNYAYYSYNTECKNIFTLEKLGIQENSYKFCPNCGKEISEDKNGG